MKINKSKIIEILENNSNINLYGKGIYTKEKNICKYTQDYNDLISGLSIIQINKL